MKLIFVYNTTGNFWAKKIDLAHKMISPSTYSCNLCKLTHGSFFEKEAWSSFKNTAAVEMEFTYKEKFRKQFPSFGKTKLPVVLFECNLEPVYEFITAKEFEGIHSVEHFIEVIEERLSKA